MTNKKRRSKRGPSDKGGDKLTAKQLQQSILQLFRSNPERRFTPKQIIQHLQLKNNKDAVRYAIEQLQANGKLKTVPALKLKETPKEPDADRDFNRNATREINRGEQPGRAKRSGRRDDDGAATDKTSKPDARRSSAKADGNDRRNGRSRDADETTDRRKDSGERNGDKDRNNRRSGGFTKANGEAAGQPRSGEKPGRHRRSSSADDELTGKLDMSRSGSGYVVVEGREQDIFITARNLGGAMNGDTVRIRTWTPRGRNKPEGEVLEVVQHAVEYFLGTYRESRSRGVVIPDRLEYDFDIAVMPDDTMGAADGDKVVVHIVEWPDRPGRSLRGRITEVLGATGSTDIEMKGILINQGFDLRHSEEAIAEAEAIPEEIDPQEAHRRLDLRDVLTFTIDPYDAKDFDDAISYRRLDNGRLEIGVHIADVSHYVQPGSALDNEAARSTTSVYLVDRVLPMLPEKLSNGVCSLRPNEDKCTFSAMFEFDDRLAIKRTYFSKTLTHSDRRFTYEEAQELIEGKSDPLGEVMVHCNEIAGKLRARRFRNGSIDFDSEEVRFRLSEDGAPLDAYVKPRQDSNMLIEDFMLLANRSVAEFIAGKSKKIEIPFPYRVHDEPDPEKMENLATFAARFDIKLDLSSPANISKSYNRLRKLAKERPELAVLGPLAIRTMAKAEYTTDNIGHYGLAFEHYTHFTSPIRRYADVLVHRILERNLAKQEYRLDKDWLEDNCRHISERERAAVKAERESTSYFQVLYIKDHVGEEFDGTIAGVIERGVFVSLVDNYCEGFVPFQHMDERYELGADRLVATAVKSGSKLQMGSNVRVQIVSADLDSRRIEMSLVANYGHEHHPGRKTPVNQEALTEAVDPEAVIRTEHARGRRRGGAAPDEKGAASAKTEGASGEEASKEASGRKSASSKAKAKAKAKPEAASAKTEDTGAGRAEQEKPKATKSTSRKSAAAKAKNAASAKTSEAASAKTEGAPAVVAAPEPAPVEPIEAKPVVQKPATKKPAAKKPAAKKPAAKKPAAKKAATKASATKATSDSSSSSEDSASEAGPAAKPAAEKAPAKTRATKAIGAKNSATKAAATKVTSAKAAATKAKPAEKATAAKKPSASRGAQDKPKDNMNEA